MTVDGNKVQFRETKDHFIYVRCPEGTHAVRVTAAHPGPTRWTFAVSALATVLLILVLALPERRRAPSLERSTLLNERRRQCGGN